MYRETDSYKLYSAKLAKLTSSTIPSDWNSYIEKRDIEPIDTEERFDSHLEREFGGSEVDLHLLSESLTDILKDHYRNDYDSGLDEYVADLVEREKWVTFDEDSYYSVKDLSFIKTDPIDPETDNSIQINTLLTQIEVLYMQINELRKSPSHNLVKELL